MDEDELVVGELELRYKRKLLEEPKLSPKWKSYDTKLRTFKDKYNDIITRTPEKEKPSPRETKVFTAQQSSLNNKKTRISYFDADDDEELSLKKVRETYMSPKMEEKSFVDGKASKYFKTMTLSELEKKSEDLNSRLTPHKPNREADRSDLRQAEKLKHLKKYLSNNR